MRFWTILILVIAGATYGAWHAFSGITGVGRKKDKEEIVEEKKHYIEREKVSAKVEEKKIKVLPVARNSVKFNHRPVPNNEQLIALTQNFVESATNSSEQRRTVVAVSDIPTNTVLLYGDLLEVERLADALKSMDQVISTCHLKTWVVFVRGDKQAGFDVVANIVSNNDLSSIASSLGGGVFSASAGIDALQLGLTLSASNGLIEIVDQPYMQLLHGTESRISTVDEIAIPSVSNNQGVTETSIEFRSVGLSFAVTPYFLSNDRVRLNVRQENGVVGAIRDIAGSEIPELSTQNLVTSAELRMGQVLVLGGVESSQREKQRGWFTKTDSRTLGHLYIVAAVYSTIPKADRVIKLESGFGIVPPFDGTHLLPSK